ncbi:GntR family transcriptional regulator [Peribacillus cavernae]|uniref:GntR family transcriptional regulator n=1 Tax=Peribacillus cavernae TaxID=1674310 RepID=A0A3S0W3R5_9BACI|nr:GntR family transcriptional regulator [Peribacillus cavernae]MDQ0219560.1 DNA-binding GntR family transcriptional regulator [Peribacillus cavernae]RUQ27033.1 GntR family transcriptional regulator [Peribacillus cavernae]
MEEIRLKPIKQLTTQDIVYKQVKEAILNGVIASEEIFTEVQLAETLNTSRTPVRGAIQNLVKEGLLVSIPRKGLTVRKITAEEQDEIFLLRSSIEVEVIKKLSKSHISREQLLPLKVIIQQQEEAMKNDDNITFIDLDQTFHLSLTRLANYTLMEQVLNNLHNLTQLMGLKAVSRKGRMKDVLKEHRQIIQAIEERDSKSASKFILDHLYKTKQTLNDVDNS